MLSNDRNIYQTARKAAGLTQEKAAEKLGIDVRSLRAYEGGERLPPDDVADLMVILYDSQYLGLQHLRASAELARNIIPAVKEVPLPQAIMHLLDHVYAFADEHRDRQLIAIGADGRIDEDERPLFDEISRDLEEIIEAAMAVRYARQDA